MSCSCAQDCTDHTGGSTGDQPPPVPTPAPPQHVVESDGVSCALTRIDACDPAQGNHTQAGLKAWTTMYYYDADNNLEEFNIAAMNGMSGERGPSVLPACVAEQLNVIVLMDRCRPGTRGCEANDNYDREVTGIIDADGNPVNPRFTGAKWLQLLPDTAAGKWLELDANMQPMRAPVSVNANANTSWAGAAWTVDGPCVVSGNCVSSPNFPSQYDNNGNCVMTLHVEGSLEILAFEIEHGYDYVQIGGQPFSGQLLGDGQMLGEYDSPEGARVHAGDSVTFHSGVCTVVCGLIVDADTYFCSCRWFGAIRWLQHVFGVA